MTTLESTLVKAPSVTSNFAKTNTYKAVEVTSPGVFNLVARTITAPGAGQVLIRVEACGVCHSDAATVLNQFPGLTYPRVPGHEAVGVIEELGPGVVTWKVGQRVGVGFFGGHDGECEPCLRGDFVNCLRPVIPGITTDGGYAEVMIAEARALASIPDELSSTDAAPLLCAGITTYNALRNARLRAGDTVAVQGIGGLGHLGIQFAKQMGFRVVALGRGIDKAELAKKLGAHIYIDTAAEDGASALLKLGGADAILATAPSGAAMGALIGGLAVRGKLIVVGVDLEPIPVGTLPLIFGGRSIHGSLTGTAIDNQDTLDFSVLQNIRPIIETVPLDQAANAFARMMDGKARFRMVLTMSSRHEECEAAGNPLIMKQMTELVPDAAAYAPVTILVDERAGKVRVSYDRMTSFLSVYKHPGATEIAEALDSKNETLMRTAL